MTLAVILLYLLGTSPAQALFLAPLIAPLVGGLFVAEIILSVAVPLALSFGLSYVANKLLAKKPEAQHLDIGGVGGAQINIKIGADVPYSLIVGRAVTAGSRVYANTGADNSVLIEIIALADHPCHRLAGAFIAGQPAAMTDLAADPDPTRGANVNGWAGTIGRRSKDDYFAMFGLPALGSGAANGAQADFAAHPERRIGYDDRLHIRFYDGTQTTADSLATSLTSANEQPWTSAAVGKGVSYVRVHSIYDPATVPGPMEWKFVVDGVRLYDPRKDSTVGGSGSHVWGNQATYEWTDNVAVIVYNIVRGIYVGAEFFYGIEGTTAEQLPLDIWFAAMNECDVSVAFDGGTEKQFTAGGEISVNTEPLEAITALLRACGGRFVEIGGIYKLYVGAPGVPVIGFVDGDIRANQADTFSMVLPLEQRINYVTGKFTSPDDGWIEKIAPPRFDPVFVTEDGRRLPADLAAGMVQTDTQVQRLQEQLLQRARRERKHTIPLPPIGFVLEPGDVFSWLSERNGYVDKLFEIDAIDYDANLNVIVSCTEVDHADYDWDAGMAFPVSPGQIIVLPPPPKVVAGFSAVPFTYLGDDGTAAPAIKLLWDDPEDPDATSILWQLRVAADPSNFTTGSSDDVPFGSLIIVGGLQPITAYQVRARFGSSLGFASDWSLWIDVTTDDIRISLADFEAHLTELVTTEFKAGTDAMQAISDMIAIAVAEQDAQNWLDKANAKGDLVVTNTLAQHGGAAVTTMAAALTDLQGAFATYQLAVTAQFGTTNAQVITNAEAIATNEAAIATNTVSVEAMSVSVTETATAIAGIDGQLAATWTVVLDVNGYVSSLAAYNDGATSGWTFVGNVFQVAFPGVGGGSPVPVFQVANVGGSPKVAIRADVVADGTITATKMVTGTITALSAIIADAAIETAKIKDLNVSTLKIAGNAVTSPAIAFSDTPVGFGGSGFNNLLSVSTTVTLESGYSYYAVVQGWMNWTGPAGSTECLLWVNSAVAVRTGFITINQIPCAMQYAVAMTGTGSPQTITADLQWWINAGGYTAITKFLSIEIMKR
jgi:hypothetical protein